MSGYSWFLYWMSSTWLNTWTSFYQEHMIQNEVAILRRVKHPNIVLLIEEFDTYNELYLVMELVKVCGHVCTLLLYEFVHHLLQLGTCRDILPSWDNGWVYPLTIQGWSSLSQIYDLEEQGGINSDRDRGAAFSLWSKWWIFPTSHTIRD